MVLELTEDWFFGRHVLGETDYPRGITMSDMPSPERRERMNAIWREVLTWPVSQRMALLVQLGHATLDELNQTMIDAGLFDTKAQRDVYAVCACGPMAGVLKEMVREALAQGGGAAQVIKQGEQPTPISERRSIIHYRIGDATAPQAVGNKIICHICNDGGGWGAGFVLALSRKWKRPEAAYRQWKDMALGEMKMVQVEPDTWVANLIGQHGIHKQGGVPPIRYEAVEEGLTKVAVEAVKLQASMHMPRIGCGLAGGTWDQIEPIIQRTLCARGVEVFVYDLG